MGTNYYLKVNECPRCGICEEVLHIGKSSAGWCFSLHVDPDEGLNSLEDWEARWTTGRIENEYGDVLTPEEMRKRITERGGKATAQDDRWFVVNRADRGPNGLARHRFDGRHCVGHGEGTWDLIAGEFS